MQKKKKETENKNYKTVKSYTKGGFESQAAGTEWTLLERECQFQSASSIDLMPRQ